MDKNELRKINVSKYVDVGTIDTKVGDDIQVGKVRNIWRILAIADDGSEQDITLYQGDATTQEGEKILSLKVPATSSYPALEIGDSITDPILSVRPERNVVSGVLTTTKNQIYAKGSAAIRLIVDYYDE